MNLLTFEHRTDGKYLIRLEHPYDAGDDVELSKPVVVNFNQVIYAYKLFDYYFDFLLLFDS